MQKNDTIELLRECDSGVKMGISSIDEVIDRVDSNELKEILQHSKEGHANLDKDLHKLLSQFDAPEGEPNPVAKSMSWVKINVKLAAKETDKVVADLITDGCDMGIKSLHKYLNKYPAADREVIQATRRLIDIEESLRRDLKAYL